MNEQEIHTRIVRMRQTTQGLIDETRTTSKALDRDTMHGTAIRKALAHLTEAYNALQRALSEKQEQGNVL